MTMTKTLLFSVLVAIATESGAAEDNTTQRQAFRNCSNATGNSTFSYSSNPDQRNSAKIELKIADKVVYKSAYGITEVNDADYSFAVSTEAILQDRIESVAGEDIQVRRTAVQLIVKSRESGDLLFDQFMICQENTWN